MSRMTASQILDFVDDNNVKFVRFSFCDIFGVQKNIAVMAGDLPKALEEGVSFDGSSIAGFMNVEESDLVLRPDLDTVAILPWRPAEGRVMQLLCEVYRPGGEPFAGNCRGFLRDVASRYRQLGLTVNLGAECEFYLFERDDRGRPTRIPIDRGGYFDVAPLDAGENMRREICLTMEAMGFAPEHSHHESGHGQNEIDFHYTTPMRAADNLIIFKQIVRAVAARSGLHVNLSLLQDGKNLFENELASDSLPGHFMAGILAHVRALVAFTNPIPNSYARFGSCEAPRYVSWSRQNRSQLVRIPAVSGENRRMELRSPDPACNPYLAFAMILAAGLDGIERRLALPEPVNCNLFLSGNAVGLEELPRTLEQAVQIATESEFVRETLPRGLAERYFEEQLRHCAALRSAADPAEYEREQYFACI